MELFQSIFPFTADTMPLWNATIFIFGACLGSFLNVCIWRIPRDESIVFKPSHCPKCDYEILWYDNIPLFSWLALKGKCRKCGKKISQRYFLVELLTGTLFLLVWLKVNHNGQPFPLLAPYLLLVMLAITTAFIDCDHGIIPNETTYPVMIAGLLFGLVYPRFWLTEHHFWGFARACAGLVAVTTVLAMFAVVGRLICKKEALGWGDVKYMGAVGACLGPIPCIFILLLGSIMGMIGGLYMVSTRKGKMKSAIRFGPYLAVATVCWILIADQSCRPPPKHRRTLRPGAASVIMKQGKTGHNARDARQ